MILFLDFDGVLHPENLGENNRELLFCCSPLLHEILRAAPGVDVVFSTSWRLLYPLDALKEMVTKGSPDLRERFIGITPHFDQRERKQGCVAQREDEIRAWLKSNGRDGHRWLALDDCTHYFHPGCAELYLCDWQTGLVDDDILTIVESLR